LPRRGLSILMSLEICLLSFRHSLRSSQLDWRTRVLDLFDIVLAHRHLFCPCRLCQRDVDTRLNSLCWRTRCCRYVWLFVSRPKLCIEPGELYARCLGFLLNASPCCIRTQPAWLHIATPLRTRQLVAVYAPPVQIVVVWTMPTHC
jgi:hypothetical protein